MALQPAASSAQVTLSTELSELIHKYLKQKVNTLAGLARQSGVPYPTLRRLVHQQTRPELETVIALLGVICVRQQAKALLNKYYPGEFDMFASLVVARPAAAEDLCGYLDDEIAVAVLQLTAQAHGCTRKSIARAYGEAGLSKLREFTAAGYVREDSQGQHVFLGLGTVTDVGRCLRGIRVLTQTFNEANLGTDATLVSSSTAVITRKGLRIIKQYGQEYRRSMQKIMAEHDGEIPVYVALLHAVSDVRAGVTF